MSSKRKKPKSRQSHASKSHKPKGQNLNWHLKRKLKKALITLSFALVVAIPILLYFKQIQEEQDLSVIGKGLPTVVQIHETGCSLCNQLRSNLGKVKGSYEDKVHFKTANIRTTKGARFASRHRVPHVTLLFFDKQGQRINTLQGVSSPEAIDRVLKRLAR